MTATTEAEGETTGAAGKECQCEPCRERAKKGKAWRWITRHSDLTKPPLPTLRWVLLLILGLCCVAAGIPLDVKDWLAPIIIAGALILPDVAGIGVAGFRLDLKQAQDQITALRHDLNLQARASSTALIAIGDKAIERAIQAITPAAAKVNSDQASGGDSPWEGTPGVDIQAGKDVRS